MIYQFLSIYNVQSLYVHFAIPTEIVNHVSPDILCCVGFNVYWLCRTGKFDTECDVNRE